MNGTVAPSVSSRVVLATAGGARFNSTAIRETKSVAAGPCSLALFPFVFELNGELMAFWCAGIKPDWLRCERQKLTGVLQLKFASDPGWPRREASAFILRATVDSRGHCP